MQTGAKPAMWGESIIGFGDEHLIYASGRELDWFKIGFSPSKKEISLYLMFDKQKSLYFINKTRSPQSRQRVFVYKIIRRIRP